MGKCATDIRKFHDKEVKLSDEDRKDIRQKAEANQDRIKHGLADNDDPKPLGFQTQGSYAMRTMIQRPDKDYDIDAGCYFSADDIESIGPRALRRKVRDAADDGRFNTEPEVKKNCVRILYNEGYHVDVPVYKAEEDEDGNVETVRLSSVDEWRNSDPKGVTDWFNSEVKSHKPGDLRKLVRMLKALSPNSPSGLVLSVLASKIVISDGDDDDMLYSAMGDIKMRLDGISSIHHPVVHDEVLEYGDSDILTKLRNKLENALTELKVRQTSDKKSDELKAWKKVFGNHAFFDDLIKEAEEKEKEKSDQSGSGKSSVTAAIIGAAVPAAKADPPAAQAQRPYAGKDG